jgi:hypothetical protein
MSRDENAVVQEVSNTEFNDRLRVQINDGTGFVPFIGSGCSSPSGILMGVQFDEYLSYTVFLCVADTDSIAETGLGLEHRWDLRGDGWPKQPNSAQVRVAQKWIRLQFDKICAECGFRALPTGDAEIESLVQPSTAQKPEDLAKALTCPLVPRILCLSNSQVDQETLKRLLPFFGSQGLERGGYSLPGISPTSEDAIIERAIRALYDWRATLKFLSELKLVDYNTLLVENCEQAVIDGFNVHITRGRKPNLVHNMLCHLAGPARFRVILTTNFDSLLEDAFQEMKERVEVISVSIKGALPDPGTVHARNTLVKLHGTLSETRADFSLDESPSRENKRRFFHYVRGSYPGQKKGQFVPAQLLVCGYSGADNRCVEMIKYVLDADPEARLYWICYSKSDLEHVNRIFREWAYKDKGVSRITATVTERCDLLLYELFQCVCLSLPGGGPSFQYSYHIPPDVSRQDGSDPPAVKEAEKIVNRVVGWYHEPMPNSSPVRKLLVVDGKVGVLATLRHVLLILTGKKRGSAIWLELQDYQNTYCLAYNLFQIISHRLGLFQLGYADLLPARLIREHSELKKSNLAKQLELDEELTGGWKKHIKFLVDHYFSIVPGKWAFFLYGRKGPGACAGWNENSFWDDEEYGTGAQAGRFPPFLKALCEVGFHVIYAPYSKTLKGGNEPKTRKIQEVLEKQFGQVELKNLDEADYPEKIPIHSQESLESWFPTLDGDAPQGKFPGMITYWCEWPASLKFPDFDRSAERLFEGWVSGHANRHVVPSRTDGDSGAARDPEAISARKRYPEDLQFLYAVTLFRSARPYSSFADKGVLSAPHLFNMVARDNDWERHQNLDRNLADLRDLGFLFQKPGGFVWTYRDLRLGLRRMIDSLPIEELKKYQIERFAEWRSHYHYWIADWYLRAFNTSGHADPLMEGLYHLYQAIEHLDTYRRDRDGDEDCAWHRYRLWRKAACDMAKALRVGSNAICLWLGPPSIQAWFPRKSRWAETFVNSIQEQLRKLLVLIPKSDRSEQLKQHAQSVLGVLKEEISQLSLHGENEGLFKSVEGQVVNTQFAPTQKRDEVVREPSFSPSSPSLGRVSIRPNRPFRFWPPEEPLSGRLRPCSRPGRKSRSRRLQDLGRINISPPKKEQELYDREPIAVSGLCNKIRNNEYLADGLDSRQLTDEIRDWQRDQLKQDPSDHYLFCLIQQLNERAFLFLRDAKLRQLVKLNQRLDKNQESDERTDYLGLTEEVKHRWICVTVLVSSALEFCRFLHPMLAPFEAKERVKALCLYGVALARLCRFYEAHRRLNEAHALLSKINVSASESDVLLGILELRSAEAHLLEAMLVKELHEEANPSNGRLAEPDSMGKALYERYSIELPLYPDTWRAHDTRLRRLRVAKIDDGWCALERAERLLSGRLRSSHWWSRLCVLKLRCLVEQPLEKEPEYRSLARRIQSKPLDQIYDLLYKGLAGCREETRASSRLRLIDLALRNADHLTRDDFKAGKEALSVLKKVVNEQKVESEKNDNPYPQVKEYAQNILHFRTDWEHRLDTQHLTELLTGRSIAGDSDYDVNPPVRLPIPADSPQPDDRNQAIEIVFDDHSKMRIKTSDDAAIDELVRKLREKEKIKRVCKFRKSGEVRLGFDFEKGGQHSLKLTDSDDSNSNSSIVVRDRTDHVQYSET